MAAKILQQLGDINTRSAFTVNLQSANLLLAIRACVSSDICVIYLAPQHGSACHGQTQGLIGCQPLTTAVTYVAVPWVLCPCVADFWFSNICRHDQQDLHLFRSAISSRNCAGCAFCRHDVVMDMLCLMPSVMAVVYSVNLCNNQCLIEIPSYC
jgi:hypothetical protein